MLPCFPPIWSGFGAVRQLSVARDWWMRDSGSLQSSGPIHENCCPLPAPAQNQSCPPPPAKCCCCNPPTLPRPTPARKSPPHCARRENPCLPESVHCSPASRSSPNHTSHPHRLVRSIAQRHSFAVRPG